MSKAVITESLLTNIADAIRYKDGSSAHLTPAQMATAIRNIPTGGGGGDTTPRETDDVLLVDYDGTLLHSYSKSAFLALSALPDNPTHTGLVSQGWNWTLADAQTYVSNHGALVIGQNYTTSDGKTRAYISLEDDTCLTVTSAMRIVGGSTATVVIDWGDGTSDTLAVTMNKTTVTHTYQSAGDYVITLQSSSNYLCLGYMSSDGNAFLDFSGATSSLYAAARRAIKKLEIGDNINALQDITTYGCSALETISIPSTMTGGIMQLRGSYTNTYCPIKCIVLPNGVRSLYSNGLSYLYRLRYISLPATITAIMGSALNRNLSLQRLHIPDARTNTANYIANSCASIKRITGIKVTTGNYDFGTCTALESAELCEGVKILSQGTFQSAYNLHEIKLPSTLTQVEAKCWDTCYNLTKVIALPTTPPSLGASTVFSGCNLQEIIVPYSADHSVLDAYKAATNWAAYAAIMREAEP